jgi:hypothetical protein
METISRHHVFETAFEAAREYENPFWDVDARVYFTAPSGRRQGVDAFWDGARTWRVRFSPDEVGLWQWRSECPADAGLHGHEGRFTCEPYTGKNIVYRHGPVRLAENRRHFVWGDEDAPFFWLADTAWNGVLRAHAEDWDRYLASRRAQRFTAVQFVCTQWRGGHAVLGGEVGFEGTSRITLHPAFFRARDAKVAAINAHGLVAAPVLLWALTPPDPGRALEEADAIRLARYLVARWGAHQVVWLLGGDGHYEGEQAVRWHRIGEGVFGDRHDRLVTMHPCGQSWVGSEFRGQAWFDFIGYQSGHGSSDEHLRWLVQGPPATRWDIDPPLPVVNLEPNYEAHPSYHADHRFTDHEVRRAAYWSLLVSPPAGVTYGNNPIWVWPPDDAPEVPENHERIGEVEPWHAGVEMPGVHSMSVLHQGLAELAWWDLRPAPELVAVQPGDADPARFIAAAKTEDGTLAVVYTPAPGRIALDLGALGRPAVAHWFDPRTGATSEAGSVPSAGPASAAARAFQTPGEGDWVLYIKKAR